MRTQHSSAAPNGAKVAPSPPRRGRIAAVVLLSITAGAVARPYIEGTNGSSSIGLNTSTFIPFALVNKERVSSTSSLFTLRAPKASQQDLKELWNSAVWSIEIKQPQLQIARAYTPLPPLPHHTEEEMHLLIRKEKNGEVSGYLHALPELAAVELRGPGVEYQIPENVEEVVFLAGGTGIAPALQVANALRGKARVSILWANRRREDCVGGRSDTVAPVAGGWFSGISNMFGNSASDLARKPNTASGEQGAIVRHLEHLKGAGKNESSRILTVNYYVDEEGTFIKTENVKAALSTTTRQSPGANAGRKLVFVSGPEGFINHWAGPKMWAGGREVQGPLRGALSQMDLRGWEVIKL